MLYIFETHPVQYHAPVWRRASELGVPLKVFYGGDFSVKGYHDKEFNASYCWDTDLLHGYECEFLCDGVMEKPLDYDSVTSAGIGSVMREGKPDSVLVLGYSHTFDRTAITHALINRVPIIYRGEANDSAVMRSPMKNAVRRFVLSILYHRISRFLNIGEEAKRHYHRHGVNIDKIIFSPYCIDASTFRVSENDRVLLRMIGRQELSIQPTDKVILYSGKLSHRKGVDLLVQAASQCSSDVVLLFVGDGELRDRVEKQASGKVKAIFAGFQNQSKLSRFYHTADILVLPSRHSETWGLVVNEGLAHGLPAVVTDAVGCRWDLVISGKTGEIARRGDADDLAKALACCLRYSDSLGTRQSCRDVVQPYSVEEAALGVLNAYESVVSGN